MNLVVAAARDLPRVNLHDALEICLLLRDGEDRARYQRAAVRWVGRFALEARGVSLEALDAAIGAFDELPAAPTTAMEELLALCNAHRIR